MEDQSLTYKSRFGDKVCLANKSMEVNLQLKGTTLFGELSHNYHIPGDPTTYI